MNSAILCLLAAGLSAAQVTVPPALNRVFVAADADACTVAAGRLATCADDSGGFVGLATVDEDELLGCACCSGGRPLSTAYASCSEYLEDDGRFAATDIEAYGTFYSWCSSVGACSGMATATGAADTTTTPEATMTEDRSATITSMTGLPTLSSISGSGDDDDNSAACWDMIDLFQSCGRQTPGFDSLSFSDQASCYCCHTVGDQAVFDDGLDENASSCAIWARTGASETVYPIASQFASFCDIYSPECSAEVTTPTDEPTPTPTATADDVTNTSEDETSEESATRAADDDDDAAPGLRVGAMFGFVAAAAMALAM